MRPNPPGGGRDPEQFAAAPAGGHDGGTDDGGDGPTGSATVAELRFSADALALGPSFERRPEMAVRVEPVAAGRPSAPFSYAWVGGCDDHVETLEADPSVAVREVLCERAGESLCELGFGDHVSLVVDVVTKREGTVLRAGARRGTWSLRVRYPDRELLRDTVDTLDRFDVRVELSQIGCSSGSMTTDLTDKQRETVAAAFERGYFEIPREVSLEELADELDVTHQALSERLRRGERALLRAEFGD